MWYVLNMPKTSDEARLEILQMLKERDLTMAWLSRRIGENLVWVSRRMKGRVRISIEDYSLMKTVLSEIPVVMVSK